MPVEVYGPDFAFLPRAELLSFEEIAIVARAFVDLGARTLRITGGEPLVRRHLDRLIGLLRALASRARFGWRLCDLAQHCGIDKGTARRMLSCLVSERSDARVSWVANRAAVTTTVSTPPSAWGRATSTRALACLMTIP